jgi:uncharacterized membrane protein YkgB
MTQETSTTMSGRTGPLAGRVDGRRMLRLSLAVVFFWFGILKPFEVSPAVLLVSSSVEELRQIAVFLPYDIFMPLLGWWETAVGLLLLSRRTVKLAIAFMVPQMLSTMVALVMLPDITFLDVPLVPSAAGMYIVKNWVLLSGGLVVLASVREDDES